MFRGGIGCLVVLLVVLYGGTNVFYSQVVKDPKPAENEEQFETAEWTLEVCINAWNKRDYNTYRECYGKESLEKLTSQEQQEMKLWGRIKDWVVRSEKLRGDLMHYEVVYDLIPYNGVKQTGRIKHYYLLKQGNRWVMLDEGFDRYVIILHSYLMHPFD